MSQGQTLVTDLRCLFSSVLVQKIELPCKPLGSGGKSNVHRVSENVSCWLKIKNAIFSK